MGYADDPSGPLVERPVRPAVSADDELDAVLILEDEDAASFVFRRVVSDLGAVPYAARTIAEARELAGQRRFACALIDKNLPDGNGIRFLEWLNAAQPGCAAILITAYGSVESAIEALRLGAADFLLKPFELETFSHRIKMQLERQRLLAEREQIQARLVENDRLAALGTLATAIVHEVNQPLTYVVCGIREIAEGTLPKLRQGTATGEDLHELANVLSEMETGARQIRSIVQEVKAFAHPAGTPTELVEVAEVVDAAMRMSGPAIRAKGKLVREDGGTPRVNAASNRLAQVFLNLLVNAADALPEAKHSTNQVRVSVDVDAAGWARVVIADNGPGIPPEVLAKLFTPFFTTKAPGAGTGLGLWICRSIVDGFGGRIEVDSAVDKGTTFRVLLPQSNTR